MAIDLLGVAVGAGCTPFLAVDAASQWAPPVMARELGSVVRSCAFGCDVRRRSRRPRASSTATGAARRRAARRRTQRRAGRRPALARLAGEERAALRRRAEAHARRVPVRLLFPLVFLVLPAFVLLTVVPGLAAGMARL